MKITAVTCHILQAKVDESFVWARGWVRATRCRSGPAAVNQALIAAQYAPPLTRPRPLRRRGDGGRIGQPRQGLWPPGPSPHRAVADRRRAVGHPGPRHAGRSASRSAALARIRAGLCHRALLMDMHRLVEEAVEDAPDCRAQGCRAIKMIGLGGRCVAAVREAIGPERELAVDASHGFNLSQALRLGGMVEALGPPATSRSRRALDMAVAGGETDFTRWGFRDSRGKDDGHRAAGRLRGRQACGCARSPACCRPGWNASPMPGDRHRPGGDGAFPHRPARPAAGLPADAGIRADAEPYARPACTEPIIQARASS